MDSDPHRSGSRRENFEEKTEKMLKNWEVPVLNEILFFKIK